MIHQRFTETIVTYYYKITKYTMQRRRSSNGNRIGTNNITIIFTIGYNIILLLFIAVIGANLCAYSCALRTRRNLSNRLPADVPPPPVLPNFIIITWRRLQSSTFTARATSHIVELTSRETKVFVHYTHL